MPSNNNNHNSSTTIPTHSTCIINKKSRSTKPKLFQCTGFGECHMVFTRSEHLARHVRKHTGEKPFECVVPGCSRRFSRFDNMMQHTQTHRTRDNATPSPLPSPASLVFEPESSPEYFTADSPFVADFSSDEEDVAASYQQRISVNQLCNNSHPEPLKELHLTQDEFEALQGFGRFRETPIFMDSFRDLASVVYIEPNPSRS